MKRILALFLVLVMATVLMATASGCQKSGANTKLLDGQTITIASWGSAKPNAGNEAGDLQLEAIAAAKRNMVARSSIWIQ